jgi:membrane-associated protein
MPRRRFFIFNIIGGILWGAGMPLLGYYIGKRIPGLDKYMELVMLGVVGISILLALTHILKDQKTRTLIKVTAQHHIKRALKR